MCVQLQLLLRCRRSPAAFLSIANQEVECTVWIQSCEVYSSPHGDPVGKKDACVWLMYRALMVNDRNHLTGIRLNVSFNFVCLSYLVSLWCHYCFNPWCTGTLLILYLQSGSRRVLISRSNALIFRVLVLPFKELDLNMSLCARRTYHSFSSAFKLVLKWL